ncbi:hypothetical protein [Allosphingosinicella sp.]|jgi:hypothetical protein|uniref:hypothetical protein n=1 Tax=Allosphingosinicella sp. TaxID=2823234 RepID=UPI002EF158A8
MDEVPPPEPVKSDPPFRWPIMLPLSLALALIYGAGIYLLFSSAFGSASSTGSAMISLGFLIGAPVGSAAVAVWVADPRGEGSTGEHAAVGLFVAILMIVVGLGFFGEGGVCVLMAAPIFFPFALIAALLAGRLRRRRSGRLYATTLPLLPLILLQVDTQVEPPMRAEAVTDSVVVEASPESVWRHLVEVRNIRPEELGWTFTQDWAGVPKPLDARLEGRGVGAIRHVSWGGGIRFGEEITHWQEGRALAWRFRFARDSIPADVERHIRVDSAYLSVDGGDYRLEPLPGGRTRVWLTTRYRLKTHLNAYCAWWGRIMIGDFHSNVLEVIRRRAEG